ncbi:MAG: peptide deformylase [Sulfitobacter sp.]|nr:peptide deformylase [Sulfitobacter sp.]
MSLLDIVVWPDVRLTQMCLPVDHITPEIVELVADMFDTMYDAPGRGLAAPQVGRAERIFVFDAGWKDGTPTPVACINPEIISLSETQLTGEEGCLSIPGVPMDISRAAEVTLRWTDVEGIHERSFTGAEAVIVQHEYDHLDGIVIYDRVEKGAVQ